MLGQEFLARDVDLGYLGFRLHGVGLRIVPCSGARLNERCVLARDRVGPAAAGDLDVDMGDHGAWHARLWAQFGLHAGAVRVDELDLLHRLLAGLRINGVDHCCVCPLISRASRTVPTGRIQRSYPAGVIKANCGLLLVNFSCPFTDFASMLTRILGLLKYWIIRAKSCSELTDPIVLRLVAASGIGP